MSKVRCIHAECYYRVVYHNPDGFIIVKRYVNCDALRDLQEVGYDCGKRVCHSYKAEKEGGAE